MENMFKFLYIFPLLLVSAYATLLPDPYDDPVIEIPPLEVKKNLGHNENIADIDREELEINRNAVKTPFPGKWELVSLNSGVSAMHAILLPKVNQVLMYDATVWKISKIPLPQEKMPCRVIDPKTNEVDCWAHSVLFDIETAKLKPLKVTIHFYNTTNNRVLLWCECLNFIKC